MIESQSIRVKAGKGKRGAGGGKERTFEGALSRIYHGSVKLEQFEKFAD